MDTKQIVNIIKLFGEKSDITTLVLSGKSKFELFKIEKLKADNIVNTESQDEVVSNNSQGQVSEMMNDSCFGNNNGVMGGGHDNLTDCNI